MADNIYQQIDTKLEAFAIRVAQQFNTLVSLLPMITVGTASGGHIKGSGLVTGDPLEVTDIFIYPEGGQWIAAIYLGGDETDLGNPAVWDKQSIAG